MNKWSKKTENKIITKLDITLVTFYQINYLSNKMFIILNDSGRVSLTEKNIDAERIKTNKNSIAK